MRLYDYLMIIVIILTSVDLVQFGFLLVTEHIWLTGSTARILLMCKNYANRPPFISV